MSLLLLHAEEIEEFSRMPHAVRKEVEHWLAAIKELRCVKRGATTSLVNRICSEMKCSVGTVYRKLSDYESKGWHGLVNKSKCSAFLGLPQAFKEYVAQLYLNHQRDTSGREVHRVIVAQWALWKRTGDPSLAIAGYSTPPPATHKGYPAGWSAKNISRFCPEQHALRLIRQGTKAASEFLPSILRTRVGTSFGQIIFWDDQDYDHKVVAPGTSMKTLRPQGFNCLDYFSGCFMDYCIRLRYIDEETEVKKSLTQQDFVWFVVRYLLTHGYRVDEQGTIFVMEHGTASGYANKLLNTANGLHNFDDALSFATGGKVKVERSGLFNSPAFAGMLFRPQSSGNFRFKSPLEGMFNLVRNHFSGIAGNIGLNARSHGPEENYGLELYTEQLLKLHEKLDFTDQELIRYPVLNAAQFGQAASSIYSLINHRTDHSLEGWDALGHCVPLIRFAPTPDAPWLTQAELAKLPPRSQELALSLLDQEGYTMPAKLSPAQVASLHKGELKKLSPSAVPLLIPVEWARKVKVKSDRTISIQDQLCGAEPFIYTARIITAHGAETLRPDLEVLAYFNPHSPETLVICNMNGSYIGTLTASNRISFADHETMIARLGERAAMKADMEAPVRQAMSGVMQDRMSMKAHNDRLIKGEPATEEEIALSRLAKASDRSASRETASLEELTADALRNITYEE